MHVQGYCCNGNQKGQVLPVPLMGRRFNPNLCSSGRALGQGQCGLGSDGHVVNRAAIYLPITDPSLKDRTRICNIHSQQANKKCVHLCVCVCARMCVQRESFASRVLLTSRVRQFGVPSSSMSGDGVADLTGPVLLYHTTS